jgi:hypothetical protein
VEEDQAEVEDAAGDALAINGDVLFVQVPAAGRICRVAILSLSLYSLPASFLNDSSRRMAL